MTTITRDEWIAEMERAMQPSPEQPEGVRVADIVEATGRCRDTVMRALHKLHARGLLIVTKGMRPDMTGVYRSATYYRIRPEV